MTTKKIKNCAISGVMTKMTKRLFAPFKNRYRPVLLADKLKNQHEEIKDLLATAEQFDVEYMLDYYKRRFKDHRIFLFNMDINVVSNYDRLIVVASDMVKIRDSVVHIASVYLYCDDLLNKINRMVAIMIVMDYPLRNSLGQATRKETMPWFQKVEEELESYRELKPGWDGYGGEIPGDKLVNEALKLLEILKEKQRLPFKVMTSGDDISFYFKTDDVYIEIGVDKDFNGFSYLVDDGKKPYGNEGLSELPNPLIKLLDIMYKIRRQNNENH